MSAKKSIWTPANVVTCIRIGLIPVFMILAKLSHRGTPEGISVMGIVLCVFFCLLCLTDKLDGYLARSRNEVTTFGKFLDPIADKLVVIIALLFLVRWGLVPVWVVAIIIAREFLVSGLRMIVSTKGVVIAASNLGKWKTATTMVAIAGLLLGRSLLPGQVAGIVVGASDVMMLVAVALTAWSGIDYFIKSRRYLEEDEEDGQNAN